MKKLPVVIALALFGSLFLNSCKKDYTCTCNVVSIVADTSLTFTKNISDEKKKIAEAECKGNEEAYQSLAALILGTATCELQTK
jgi:hypothetical protein